MVYSKRPPFIWILKADSAPRWVGAFNGVSAFNNSGMSLLDANMYVPFSYLEFCCGWAFLIADRILRVAFQTSYFMLITMGMMILAGNCGYPIFLRLIIWTLLTVLPKNERFSQHKVTLRFLLDHPRRCYTNLFPSRHTWWLLATLVVLNGTDWTAFEVLNVSRDTSSSHSASLTLLSDW